MQVHGGAVGVFLLKKRRCLEDGGGFLLQKGVCMSLKPLVNAVERSERVLTLEGLLGGVPAGLRREKGLASDAMSVRERMSG